MSSLPPPPPPRTVAAALASDPARSPALRAAALVATSTTGRSLLTPPTATTAAASPSRARTSRTRARRSSTPATSPTSLVTRRTGPTCWAPSASVPTEARSHPRRRPASSFSASRSRAIRPATRSGSSSGRAFSASVSVETNARSRARWWNASRPTSASTRREPEPTDDSPVSATIPIWLEWSTCVPPHSSRDHGPPISTTRTCSSYVSPNRAIAPHVLASGRDMYCHRTPRSDLGVRWQYMSLPEAKSWGAIALFGETYDEQVRVVEIGGPWSRELCGGTHVDHSSQIGIVALTGESSVGSGSRRVEALVGLEAFHHLARE